MKSVYFILSILLLTSCSQSEENNEDVLPEQECTAIKRKRDCRTQ